MATLRDALAPGSYLVISHGTNEGQPSVASAVEKVYNRGVATALHLRSRQDILRFFDGFGVVGPGCGPTSTGAPADRRDARGIQDP